ncbi:MFS transporter [Pseudomaricurvus alkylphenolicus]|uniref:MFS transporter n=1 Tax=Pseudomaricurvus alkylphenolicus TaxID=1306991 RepID=UPI00197D9633
MNLLDYIKFISARFNNNSLNLGVVLMQVDLQRSIQQSPMSPFQVRAIVICLMINMLDGFDVLVMAFTAASVSKEWGLQDSHLGILLSAGLVGMAIGSLVLAPLADKYGRRPLIIVCLLIISVGMFLSALAQNSYQMAILRLITGLGIGGMLASLTVIVSEYSSDRWRSMAISCLQAGYPIGAVVGGIIATFLISEYGWRSVFMFGAIASFSMIALVIPGVPESLDFLISKRTKNGKDKINDLLGKLGRAPIDTFPELPSGDSRPAASISNLFSQPLKRTTLMSWTSFFMVMFSFYFVLSWTPKLLVAGGLSPEGGITAGVLINVGGVVGGLLLGYISSRVQLNKLIGTYMVLTAAIMVLFGVFSSNTIIALGLGVVIGFFLFGSMIGLYALVPVLYPTEIRTTGMGWAIGVGRVGAILSPLIAGALLELQWNNTLLFIVFSLPLVLSVITVRTIKTSVIPS